MANQHTLTIPLSQATERQLLVHIASRMETHMADMTAALDRLAASLAKEIADIRDDLLTQIDGLTAESQAAKDALAATDPETPADPEQPEEPVDPEPGDGEPTDPETPANPEQPSEPQPDPDQPVDPNAPVQ